MSDLGGSRPESKGDSKGIGDIDGSEAVGRRGSTNRRRSSLGKGLGQSLADLSTERDATKPAFLKKVGNPILEAMALKYRNSFFSSSFVIMNPIQNKISGLLYFKHEGPRLSQCFIDFLRYFESGDEAHYMSQSYEDVVKTFIEWVQTTQNLPPPDEIDSAPPEKGELQRLKEQIGELTKKLEDIDKIEGASGVTKMQSMVRKVSNARRISKGLMSKGSK